MNGREETENFAAYLSLQNGLSDNEPKTETLTYFFTFCHVLLV